MRSFVLVASLALFTVALVAPCFAAPTCGCNDEELVQSCESSANNKESNYGSADNSADKCDVSSTKNGVTTNYGSDNKDSNFKKGSSQASDSCVNIKGDQGSSYSAKQSSSKNSVQEGSNKEQSSYYNSGLNNDSC